MKYFFENRKEMLVVNRSLNLDFESHLHEHTELGFVFSGTAVLNIEGESFELKKDDVFCVFPNVIHSYECSDDMDAAVLIFSAELFEEYEKVFRNFVPSKPVISGCTGIARELFGLLIGTPELPRNTQKGMILAILGIITDKLCLVKQDDCPVSTIKSILMFCDSCYSEPVTINDAAERLHLSRSHIAHTMRSKLNITFSEYINKKRLEKACDMLRTTDMTVTDIAFFTGFNSVRTFNRIFAAQIGETPVKYRKQI